MHKITFKLFTNSLALSEIIGTNLFSVGLFANKKCLDKKEQLTFYVISNIIRHKRTPTFNKL